MQNIDQIKKQIDVLDDEIRLLDKTIPDYKKSYHIFGVVSKICAILTIGLFAYMQTMGERKAFLTMLIVTIAATVASLSDKKVARKQQEKRDRLSDERSELAYILSNTKEK